MPKDDFKKSAASQNAAPPPTYNVFISSSEDMKEYVVAVQAAVNEVKATPMGMKRFTTSIMDPPLDSCYTDLSKCQFCICIVGFRYGILCKDTNLSYSELEFDKAEELGLPVLVFNRSGTLDADSLDGDNWSRLQRFKEKLKNSSSRRPTETRTETFTSFTTPDDLREKVARALREEFDRKQTKSSVSDATPQNDYLKGAEVYKNFIRLPNWYRDQVIRLRVRMDGKFASWRLKEELYEAFGFAYGDAIFLNDVMVTGADYSDMDDEAKYIDVFAGGAAAQWILESNITTGDVFEGDFKLAYKLVKNISSKSRMQIGASDAYIAKLIFLDTGNKKVIARREGQSKLFSTRESSADAMDILRQFLS